MSVSGSVIGVILLIIGLAVIFSVIGIGVMFLGPLILLLIGVFLFKKSLRLVGFIFIILGILAIFNILFHINIGGILVAVIFLYMGVRLLRKKDKPLFRHEERRDYYSRTIDSDDKDWADKGLNETKKAGRTSKSVTQQKSLIGDFHLMNQYFELGDMNIWQAIGDVKIDLSKAMIPEGETVLVINGWLGDIDIYIPYDVDVSVNASVTFGGLEILNRRQGGFGRQLSVATKDYQDSTRRVKIILSLFIGDIDVRFL